ncbi:hypothetical protein AMK26_33580 [Streptomyces sp. CB03234]|uniref:DUF4190 domain-containing protein n=1 Tax=Streptomyces sp. (strain CB03234) TaxID=1703937 RepID=UPI0009606633|nr:DUF4190 domain-containing protein [Streptomyces sp. CB03234]OKJ93438.1 hypothetical protein AMK26_33580 [Streptomyces sp. CB03234]
MSVPHSPYPHQHPVPAPATLNAFAVAALVTSLLCLAPLGVVFGIVALVQISRRAQRGKGLAVAGVAVSGAVLLLLGIAAAVVDVRVWAPPARGADGEVVKPGWTTFHSIGSGDCFTPRSGLPGRDGPPTPGTDVRLLPCDAPHRAEAYATFRLPEQDRAPGRDEVVAIARPQCAKFFLDYTADPIAFGPLQTYFFHPDERGWAAGQRRVLCWVARPGNALLDSSVRLDAAGLDAAQADYLMALKPLNSEGVLRPAKSPRDDLADARAWAARMAEAQAETVRHLEGVELPGGAEQAKARLVAELKAGVPFWLQAAKAPDATSFLGHLRSVDNHSGNAHTRRIRALLDLPTPTALPPQPST